MSKEEKDTPKEPTGMGRRKHIRFSIMGTATLTVRGGAPLEVYMGCIGRGGAGLYSLEKLETSQLVVLNLKVPQESGELLEMKYAARVRYTQPAGKLYIVGLKFEKMAAERYALFLRHLKFMKDLQL
jgi:hypothetical protein